VAGVDLSDLSEKLRVRLDAKTAARERGLADSRNAIRACGNAIRAMHRLEFEPASGLLDEAQRHVDGARSALEAYPELLGAIDEIYTVLVTMDYPDGITMGLRRLTDVARSIIERTRGDYTTSKIQFDLRRALEEHSGSLEQRG
jgi:predicted translin family RNA/ssDNA-binding protein